MKKIDIRHWILDIRNSLSKQEQGLPVNALRRSQWQTGQALVTLLFFMIMGITITTTAIIVVLANAAASTANQQGADAYYIAQSGVEEAMLHLIRNPAYKSPETFTVGDGTVSVTINNNSILATGSAQNAVRTIKVSTVYNNNVWTFSSWQEL